MSTNVLMGEAIDVWPTEATDSSTVQLRVLFMVSTMVVCTRRWKKGKANEPRASFVERVQVRVAKGSKRASQERPVSRGAEMKGRSRVRGWFASLGVKQAWRMMRESTRTKGGTGEQARCSSQEGIGS